MVIKDNTLVADQDDSLEKLGQVEAKKMGPVKEEADQIKEDSHVKDEKVTKPESKPTSNKDDQRQKEKDESMSQKFLKGVEGDKEKVQALQEKVEERVHLVLVVFLPNFFVFI